MGFSVGLNWFWVGFPSGFGLLFSWVSRWVLIDFDLGFLIACVDFGLIFLLILVQLCVGLSTIQMVCVGVGWVLLGCCGGGGVGLVVGWLSYSSSFFYVLLLGCCGCWGREVVR